MKTNHPWLTILTPSFNYGRYLVDAIDSVQGQDSKVQHVVMDAASDDNTISLLRRRPGVTWRSEPDGGQSHALNKAVSLARGQYVGWLNADEFYLPWAFSVVKRALELDPSADVIYGDAVFVDEAGRFVRLLAQHPMSTFVLRHYGCFIPSCATFFRRESLPNSPWDQDARFIMDWDLFMSLVEQDARFIYVPQPLAAFRLHRQQVTAEPFSRESPEGVRLDAKHGLHRSRAKRLIARWRHRQLKVVSGSIHRERDARELMGKPFDWFKDDSATDYLASLHSNWR